MRILFTNNPPVIMYGIAPGWAQIGGEYEILPLWSLPYAEQGETLSRKIESFRPDYIFTEGDPPNFNRAALLEVCRSAGLPIIYWAIQDPVWFQEISKYCAVRADFVFTTTVELLDEYERLGCNAHLLMFACNTDFHHRVQPIREYCHDFVMVGSNYNMRERAARNMLEPLVRGNFDLRVWGHWWLNESFPFRIPKAFYGGLLSYDQLPAVYSSAKIVLGMHLDDSSATQTSVRTYEALGCGAFYLTQHTRAHENLFEKGVHLDWASDKAEFMEKARFYLCHEKLREQIARQGQQHVHARHTYAQRARQLWDTLRAHG